MPERLLSIFEEGAAVRARTEGREVRVGVLNGRRVATNPHKPDSFHAFCWTAGYKDDGRNIIELHEAWRKENKR